MQSKREIYFEGKIRGKNIGLFTKKIDNYKKTFLNHQKSMFLHSAKITR